MSDRTPTALVLLASEQLWPNIHSVECWGKTLKRVLIYHTDNAAKSAEPARRLAWFCAQEPHDLEAELIPGTGTPEDVFSRLARRLDQHPGESWVINATGGTKPMYDGAASFRGRAGVQVIYRELGPKNLWFSLGRTADGVPTATRFDGIAAGVTDAIGVQRLLRTLWETDTLELTFGPPDTGRRPVPEDIARALVETEGDWREAFARTGVPLADKVSGGEPFERYVVAALLEMGVTEIAHSVKQEGRKAEGGGKRENTTQEIDIVANHGSRLLVFDCKLRTEEDEGREVEGITSQIRQAAQTARRLGLGGEVVLLRPNREIIGTVADLAADLRVRVIDERDRGRFFQKLAEFVGCEHLPVGLLRTDRLLSDPVNARRAFPKSAAVRRLGRATRGGPVIDLEPLCGDWPRENGERQDWAVVRIRHALHYLQYANRSGLSRQALDVAIRTALARFATEIRIDIASSGNTLYALFVVDPDNESAFRGFLTARAGQPLVD